MTTGENPDASSPFRFWAATMMMAFVHFARLLVRCGISFRIVKSRLEGDSMSQTEIDSFEQLHRWIETHRGTTTIYRGVKDVSYELIPSVGRYNKKNDAAVALKKEKYMLTLFKQQALPYLDAANRGPWEWMAIAQHHGMPTRLLDWTRNPLVAAFFAVTEAHDGDSLLYAYQNNRHINPENEPDPFAVERVSRFVPSHITPRITAQVGLFTIHPNPRDPFESKEVTRGIIKREFRKKLKKTLYKYGIHRASLFPGLDGLCDHIKWLQTDTY